MDNPLNLFKQQKPDERLGFLVKIDKSDKKGSNIAFDINIGNITFKELDMLYYYLGIIQKALDKKKEAIRKDEDVDLDYSKDVVLEQGKEIPKNE